MKRVERFNRAFEHLRGQGKFHTQKELAACMDASEANISKALKGDKKVLTDSFLRRFNDAFGSVFNIDWLITGDGDVFLSGNQIVSGSNNTTSQNSDNTTNNTSNNFGDGCGGAIYAGRGGVSVDGALMRAFDEIAAQRRVTEKTQAQMNELIQIIKSFADGSASK